MAPGCPGPVGCCFRGPGTGRSLCLEGRDWDGTTQFKKLIHNPSELRLIEPLRTLRMLHYAAWLAARWNDPVFPATFPWFNTTRYWGEHILELREQLALLTEPPLELG